MEPFMELSDPEHSPCGRAGRV